jgi:hypothetical protein
MRQHALSKLMAAGLLVLTLVTSSVSSQAEEVTLTVVWHAGICAETLLNIAKDYL